MYKKIYDYIVNIEDKEREFYFEHIDKFMKDYENGFESYKEFGKRLNELVNENKKFEDLEEIENFLYKKIYNND